MTPDTLVAALQDSDVIFPLICSVIAGAAIGAEREFNRKPAGIRTHTLVCFASALMTLLGLRTAEWVAAFPVDTQIVTDMARMPHAILTGVGFLGAGVIFREGASVQGLTTAASLWLTAALGIVFGTGLLELGLIGTIIALLVLVVLRVLQGLAPSPPFAKLEVELPNGSTLDAVEIERLLEHGGFKAGPVGVTIDKEAGVRRYDLLISSKQTLVDPEAMLALLPREGFSRVTVTSLSSEAFRGR